MARCFLRGAEVLSDPCIVDGRVLAALRRIRDSGAPGTENSVCCVQLRPRTQLARQRAWRGLRVVARCFRRGKHNCAELHVERRRVKRLRVERVRVRVERRRRCRVERRRVERRRRRGGAGPGPAAGVTRLLASPYVRPSTRASENAHH